eukprot:6025954-Pyramimonas_sp.AAC.1
MRTKHWGAVSRPRQHGQRRFDGAMAPGKYGSQSVQHLRFMSGMATRRLAATWLLNVDMQRGHRLVTTKEVSRDP